MTSSVQSNSDRSIFDGPRRVLVYNKRKSNKMRSKHTARLKSMSISLFVFLLVTGTRWDCGQSLSLTSFSSFHGTSLSSYSHLNTNINTIHRSGQDDRLASTLTMRKQKASDRRTRRLQRGDVEQEYQQQILETLKTTMTNSPMSTAGAWKQKRNLSSSTSKSSTSSSSSSSSSSSTTQASFPSRNSRGGGGFPSQIREKTGGRGRSRKRATLYNSLSTYHNNFFALLTNEYRMEEQEVLGRIQGSIDDPLSLEIAGHALLDMIPERRGNLFAEEIYRLRKASDATVVYSQNDSSDDDDDNDNGNDISSSSSSKMRFLPPNSKFSVNDIIMLTLQPRGSGDIFDPEALPTASTATSIEARVTATGPTYVDIAVSGGCFEANFGLAPNDYSRRDNKNNSNNNNNNNNKAPSSKHGQVRLRADRFFSDIPYSRMVAALTQLTAIPDRNKKSSDGSGFGFASAHDTSTAKDGKTANQPENNNIYMDDLLKETIISSHAFTDPTSTLFHDVDAFDLQHLNTLVSKPPMPNSVKLANQALAFMQKNPQNLFNPLNGPQLAAIGAALTRKLTMIQGPPGSGKTSTAGAIGFGFTHQCRSISPNAKVLACAFSNVGADNLAESFLRLGLKVVRVGKASAVSENLWGNTLDAAIDADPEAQKALEHAARATAQLASIRESAKQRNESRGRSSNSDGLLSERTAREAATMAVKKSILACNKAAAKALRETDIIVSTSIGAADPRLMAACGLNSNIDQMVDEDDRMQQKRPGQTQARTAIEAAVGLQAERTNAPDGLPPLSLPFVIVDEACQSVEPATLIPLTASNSCRALVLLGDPCQLPATVKSDPDSVLAVSLMERLAATMPAPMVNTKTDISQMDSRYLDDLPMKQTRSLMRSYGDSQNQMIYRKRFAGSLLLGVQYRMHPSIAALPSTLFYDGMLKTPKFLGDYRPFPKMLNDIMPSIDPSIGVRFINVGGQCHEKKGETNTFTTTTFSSTKPSSYGVESSTSFSNMEEATRVVTLIKEIMRKSHPQDVSAPKSIGVVTPYSAQVQLIKNLISQDKEMIQMVSNPSASIEVKSVDGYQGRERDVIIFSAVRSNRRGNIGFLSDWRRLNVALTRARQALLVVGDVDTLIKGDKHWAGFHKWCQGVGCMVDDF